METYSDWAKVPPHLKTKTGLRDAGLKLARGQQAVAIKTHWDRKVPNYLLYDMREAVPKKPLSEAQKAALEKAKAASLAKRTCTRCGFVEELSRHYRGKWYVIDGLCPDCRELEWRAADRQSAIEWAISVFARADKDQIIILDTETADLHTEVIELAIINLAGETLYSSRFKNTEPIAPGATAVHGIKDADLLTCPTFKDEYQRIKVLVESAPTVIIYNADYDVGVLRYTCALYDLDPFNYQHMQDLFGWNNVYINEWSHYWKSYRWQPLGGDHTALGDCHEALKLLREMAEATSSDEHVEHMREME